MSEATQTAPVQMLDVEAVCAMMSVSKPTVWRWVKRGILPAPFKIGSQTVRWRVEDIAAFQAGLSRDRAA